LKAGSGRPYFFAVPGDLAFFFRDLSDPLEVKNIHAAMPTTQKTKNPSTASEPTCSVGRSALSAAQAMTGRQDRYKYAGKFRTVFTTPLGLPELVPDYF